MVLIKVCIIVIIIAYLAIVGFIFYNVNVKQNQWCGIPPIRGCVNHDNTIHPTPAIELEY